MPRNLSRLVLHLRLPRTIRPQCQQHRRTTVRIGDSTERLSERAQPSGADERMARWIPVSDEERWLAVTFTGFTPISRHICSIKANENVTSVQYVYLD